MLQLVEWRDIRVEKFPLTPVADFEIIRSTAESLVAKRAAGMKRVQERMAAEKCKVSLLKGGYFRPTCATPHSLRL